jgi:glycosyltransferase involved in cell wall biosynthesis
VRAITTPDVLLTQSSRVADIEYFGDAMSNEAIAQMMQLSNCYISPYKYEGFNLPVLEAMAVGLPVIVSKGGSTDDFVTDETDGFKVETEIVMREGVQRVNRRLKGWQEGAWEEKVGGVGWVEKAKSVELVVNEDDLVNKMTRAIVEEATFERGRKTRVERVKETFNWDVIAEKIVDAGIR